LHPEDDQLTSFEKHGNVWRTALFIGVAGVVFWTLAMVGSIKMNLLLVFLIIIPWASLALTWKRPSLGGVLLIIAGFLPLVFLALRYLDEQSGAIGAAMLMWFSWLLILISGILFITTKK